MKKFLTALLLCIFAFSTVSLVGCNDDERSYYPSNIEQNLSLYVPDGAPALSVARLLNDKTIFEDVDINVVLASTITTYVTGEKPKADICILPINAAVKELGNGETYKMLGTVTQGNLFIMKKETGENITSQNLDILIGKKVGVINLANVPGLTFKAILNDNEIPFSTLTETDGEVKTDKVNLIALSGGQEVLPNSACDYFVVPEPAATTKQGATNGKLSIAGSLQELYSEEGGYPQAVIVAKKSVINSNQKLIKDLLDSFAENKEWLIDEETTSQNIVNAVISGFVDFSMAPTFSASNLNKNVINNCAIELKKSKDSKTAVIEYMNKINAITDNAFGVPSDAFFYEIQEG